MEVVASPRHPVVAIKDVWVSVVPCPEEQLNSDYIEWNVDENNSQPNCNKISSIIYLFVYSA